MKKYLKTPRAVRLATLFAMIPALFLGGCGQQTECENSIDTAMGTVISQTVYVTGNSPTATNGETDEKVTEVVLQKLNDLEQQELSWRLDSAEVAKINATAGKGPIQVSAAMAGWLKRCLQISEQTGGAFDVSIGKLSRLWDIDTWAAADDPQDYELPEREEIEQACALAGWKQMILEQRTNSTVVSIPAGMQIDLGAVGKGVALDEIRKTLEEYPEVSGAVISVGGSILTYGNKPEGGTWQIAVTDPLEPSQSAGVLTLAGGYCVSTSGDYERYVEVDGVRYHHILDPATGYPARSGLTSVTVVCDDGLNADGLSTACFVLGKEKAEELVETSRTSSYDFTQVEAYVNQHVAQQSSEMFRLIEAAEQKACDVSPEPIIPDTCKHNYDLDKVVREEFRNMPIGRDFIKVTYYYVCTKCGDTKTEVETYDA